MHYIEKIYKTINKILFPVMSITKFVNIQMYRILQYEYGNELQDIEDYKYSVIYSYKDIPVYCIYTHNIVYNSQALYGYDVDGNKFYIILFPYDVVYAKSTIEENFKSIYFLYTQLINIVADIENIKGYPYSKILEYAPIILAINFFTNDYIVSDFDKICGEIDIIIEAKKLSFYNEIFRQDSIKTLLIDMDVLSFKQKEQE